MPKRPTRRNAITLVEVIIVTLCIAIAVIFLGKIILNSKVKAMATVRHCRFVSSSTDRYGTHSIVIGTDGVMYQVIGDPRPRIDDLTIIPSELGWDYQFYVEPMTIHSPLELE